MQTTSNRRKRKKERLHTYENKVGVWLTVCLECSGKTFSFSLKRQIDIDIFRLAVTATTATAATNAKWKITTRKIEKWKYGFLSFCWSVSQDSRQSAATLTFSYYSCNSNNSSKGAVKNEKARAWAHQFSTFLSFLCYQLIDGIIICCCSAMTNTEAPKTSYNKI